VPVAVVTDSTASLSAEQVTRLGLWVVPVAVLIAGPDGTPQPATDTAAVADALRTRRTVTTSRPSPSAFAATYAAAAAAGATAVVSVHLSGAMSGTVDAARLAADGASVPVTVVDSRVAAAALGFAVTDAARAAAAGAPAPDVAAAAARRAAATTTVFFVDSVEYLRRGGRVGTAEALIGSALSVRPLLRLVDGSIARAEKVRTTARALARLEELAVAAVVAAPGAGEAQVDVCVQHVAAAVRAAALADALSARLPRLASLSVAEVGAVLAAHVGPGSLAVVVAPRAGPDAQG